MDTDPTTTTEQEVQELLGHIQSIGGSLTIGGSVTRTDIRRLLRAVEAVADATLILARQIDKLERRLEVKA